MKLVDVNVLLYAVNKNAAHHRTARSWWEAALADDQPLGLAWVVLLAFLRLSTNPLVFPQPLSFKEASERIEAWLAHPNTRVVHETDDHWRLLKELLDESGTAGNLTTDAHLAALAISHGATLASFDADFGRFRRLRRETPVAP